MKPGPEMDKLIAEAMGVKPDRRAIATKDDGESAAVTQDPVNGPFFTEADVRLWISSTGSAMGYKLAHWEWYPRYSTDIAAAWDVVERLKGLEPNLHWNDETGEWWCSFNKNPHVDASSSAPLAICLAALKAMEARE